MLFEYLQEEIKANKGKVLDDPFTRRSTRPKMFSQKEEQEPEPALVQSAVDNTPKPVVKEKESPPETKKKQSTDLFNAHNFDIMIDLEVPITSKFII